MNKNKVTMKCQKISKSTGLSFNAILTHYFLESILEKIANSDENDNFIFKGGFLLANVIGIKERNTIDIDLLIRRFSLTEENIKYRFEKILQSGKDNGVTYEIQKIEEIRKEDEYGEFKIKVLCRLENIRHTIPLDITAGDPITPTAISYEYMGIFNDNPLKICTYNLETILAEKIQTIYKRGSFNGRSKDFYDVYIIYNLKRGEINYINLKNACINTFKYRKTVFDVDNIIDMLGGLIKDEGLKSRWGNYQKTFRYAKQISFDDVVSSAIDLIKNLK